LNGRDKIILGTRLDSILFICDDNRPASCSEFDCDTTICSVFGSFYYTTFVSSKITNNKVLSNRITSLL